MNRRIVGLAVPALGALLVEPLYNLTDTAIVGHLGRTPLGGLAVATAILNVVIYGCGFLSMATAPRIAFLRGQGKPESVEAVAAAGYWVAAGLGALLAILVAVTAGPVAALAGGHGAVHGAAVHYLRLAAPGIPFVLIILAGNGQFRGLADTRTAFFVTLGSNVVNVVAEVVLVYGFGMGLAGSALGTVLAQALGAVAFLARSPTRVSHRPPLVEVRRLASAAWVLIVRTLALLAALSGSTAVAARVSPTVLGGHQIALQTWFLIALSLDALAVPAQILVGEALGAERSSDGASGAGGDGSSGAGRDGSSGADAVARQILRAGVGVGVGLGGLMAATSPLVPALFTADRGVRHAATVALLIGGVSLPLAAVAFELDGILLGAGDIRYLRRAMILALAGFLPPAAAVLADHRLGVAGIWLALTGWMAARAAVLGQRWRTDKWLSVLREQQ